MSGAQAVFIPNTNNYKIQINIVYNSKDSDDTNDNKDNKDNNDNKDTNDTNIMDNSYYIIDKMRDILLEEFSNESTYTSFKKTYNNSQLYMVNDSYYIDKTVIDTIRKKTTSSFPSYTDSKAEEIKIFTELASKFTKKENNMYQDKLVKEFIKIAKTVLRDNPKKDLFDEFVKQVSTITTLTDLVKVESFRSVIGSKVFKSYLKTVFDSGSSDRDLREALRLFYNIPASSFVKKSKYEYFLNPESIINIFKIIDEYSNNDDSIFGGRRSSLNNNQTKEDIYNKYFKYVFPNKKDINNLSDPDKDKILMFYNVYYIIKNIYLLDDTIINVTNYGKDKNEKKYYISKVGLLDLKDNITHFKIEKNKVTIFIKATLKYIIENPTLQINYLIDELENLRQNFLPQSYILRPIDINNNYSNYNKIYIHDKIKYKDNAYIIDSVSKSLVIKKYIKNKEEIFFNTTAVKLFDRFSRIKQKKNQNPSSEIVRSNIIYLLYKIFKLYNNKEFKKYYIADTYIKYFINPSKIEDTSYYYYSISTGNITETKTKYSTIQKIFALQSTQGEGEEGKEGKGKEGKEEEGDGDEEEEEKEGKEEKEERTIYQEIKSSDARLPTNNIYKINVVFRCYSNKDGKKPTLIRRLVAENCLYRAQKIDDILTNTFYKAFDIPENFLYNKLSNITKKNQSNVVLQNKNKQIEKQTNPNPNPNLNPNPEPIKVDTRPRQGGSLITNLVRKKTRRNIRH